MPVDGYQRSTTRSDHDLQTSTDAEHWQIQGHGASQNGIFEGRTLRGGTDVSASGEDEGVKIELVEELLHSGDSRGEWYRREASFPHHRGESHIEGISNFCSFSEEVLPLCDADLQP